jgi:hypothetical protein
MCSLTEEQMAAITCAFLDLRGAYQAYETMDPGSHDWKSHKQTIVDLVASFDFLASAVATTFVSGDD